MSFNLDQFRSLIQRTLEAEHLAQPGAVELLLGTCAVESNFGGYIRQMGGGPALGVFQMEPATFRSLQTRFRDRVPWIASRLFEELEWDLRLAIIMARLKYLEDRAVLPPATNIYLQAQYWKRIYNTYLGKGRVETYLEKHRKYIQKVADA